MCREDTIECFDKIAPLSPERAAEIIVKGVKKNKMRIIVGHDARLIDFCKRLMPERTTRLAGHMAKKLHISKIGRFPWWLKG
jgi:short-subunit dehydrogenase